MRYLRTAAASVEPGYDEVFVRETGTYQPVVRVVPCPEAEYYGYAVDIWFAFDNGNENRVTFAGSMPVSIRRRDAQPPAR